MQSKGVSEREGRKEVGERREGKKERRREGERARRKEEKKGKIKCPMPQGVKQ